MKFLTFIFAVSFAISCIANENIDKIKTAKAGEIHRIMERAKDKWPGDYRMQSYEISQQTEAFIEIEKLKNLINQEFSKKAEVSKKSAQDSKDFYAALEKIDRERTK